MTSQPVQELLSLFTEPQAGPIGSPGFNAEFCKRLTRASGAREASIWRLMPDNRLYAEYGTNISPEHLNRFSLDLGEGVTGASVQSGRTLTVNDTQNSPRHNARMDEEINFRTRSMISAPMIFQGTPYGAVNILNHAGGGSFPDSWETLMAMIGIMYASALSILPMEKERAGMPKKKSVKKQQTTIVGMSPCIQDVLHLAMKAGRSRVPVLIYGETGTGKELAARKIHESTAGKKGPFVSINCAALPENLLESELFGHVKGAFSGASADRKGKFAAASGGTLFLDEIGEMSLTCQAKILRALQEMTIMPVGSEKEIPYDARIIAATNKDLNTQVKSGHFRKDLYYRLCGLEIHMPLLHRRQMDIPLLVRYFIDKFSPAKDRPPTISPDTMALLVNYTWPGNVRQLEQAIMAALAVCDRDEITLSDLPVWLRSAPTAMPETIVADPAPPKDLPSSLDPERDRFIAALSETRYPGTGRWNIAAAARQLSMNRKTFSYRMKKLNITHVQDIP